MTAEQMPVRKLRDHPWLDPAARMRHRLQAWQQSLLFPIRLPLVLWWAVGLGVVAFGSFLNIYMSSRIADARLQLVRLDQDQTLQEEINAELLFRIGQEADLNHIAIWAQNQGFKYRTELLWLDLDASSVSAPVDLDPTPGALNSGNDLLTPTRRFQEAMGILHNLTRELRVRSARLHRQMSGLAPLPPETATFNNQGETAKGGFLDKLWKSVLEAVNATGS